MPWWPEEQITEADLGVLGHKPADVLLGHDAPMSPSLAAALAAHPRGWDLDGLAYAQRGQAMFHRAVQQVRPRLTVSGHYHLHIDAQERFADQAGREFFTRVVVQDSDGRYPSAALLNTDTLELQYIEL